MNWQAEAACRGKTGVMYPEHNGSAGFTEAKTVCATCPVVPQCLEAGIDEPYGVWGGMEPAEREQMRGRLYPRRASIPTNFETRCPRCDEMTSGRWNRRYCDQCRPEAERERERARKLAARRNQTANLTGGKV